MILGIDASQANRQIRSGTEWYAWHLLQEFKKMLGERNDLEVRLYTRDKLQNDLAQGLPQNFKVRILRWPLKYFWGQFRLSLEMLLNPPDVLFCPAHTIPLFYPRKTFTTLHDVGFEDYPELYDKLSLWYHKWSAHLVVKHAAHIFTVSEFSKERIIENYGQELTKKITVMHLGMNKEMPIGIDLSRLKKFGLAKDTYLLYIGRLEPKKNILNLVKGYEMSGTELPLVLAGRKVDVREVEEYLAGHPELKSKVRFMGYFDEAGKNALYVGARLFLFPTLYEGFGLPILEAQGLGTPVITSNTASNPEIAGEGALFVNPDSPYEISHAIRKMIIDQDLRNEKIRLGYENVKRFNWSETARQTWEILSR